jgi:hypothetical protein
MSWYAAGLAKEKEIPESGIEEVAIGENFCKNLQKQSPGHHIGGAWNPLAYMMGFPLSSRGLCRTHQ